MVQEASKSRDFLNERTSQLKRGMVDLISLRLSAQESTFGFKQFIMWRFIKPVFKSYGINMNFLKVRAFLPYFLFLGRIGAIF